MAFGWAGKILRVDLSKRESTTVDTELYARDFIGGRGINVKILYDELGRRISSYDPTNRLCFGAGVLAGTLPPASSRVKVTSMSPNGLIQSAGIGSYIGKEIKYAGYDNIVIQGKADKPVYLYIKDDSVEFKDAAHIWGKDTLEAQQTIKKELGILVETMCIGLAAEKLVSFGSIVSGWTSAAGRGGMGTIMGSKNLKAIAIRGTRGLKIAKPEEFLAACEQAHKWVREKRYAVLLAGGEKDDGDANQVDSLLERGHFILGNWEGDAKWDEVGNFGGGLDFWDNYQNF